MPHISTTMRTPNKVETYFREKLPSLNNRLPLHDINHQCHIFSLARSPTRICSNPSHPLNNQTRQHIMPLPTMIACPADNRCHCSAIQEIIKKEFIGLKHHMVKDANQVIQNWQEFGFCSSRKRGEARLLWDNSPCC